MCQPKMKQVDVLAMQRNHKLWFECGSFVCFNEHTHTALHTHNIYQFEFWIVFISTEFAIVVLFIVCIFQETWLCISSCCIHKIFDYWKNTLLPRIKYEKCVGFDKLFSYLRANFPFELKIMEKLVELLHCFVCFAILCASFLHQDTSHQRRRYFHPMPARQFIQLE